MIFGGGHFALGTFGGGHFGNASRVGGGKSRGHRTGYGRPHGTRPAYERPRLVRPLASAITWLYGPDLRSPRSLAETDPVAYQAAAAELAEAEAVLDAVMIVAAEPFL
jgi:hypothetical protein